MSILIEKFKREHLKIHSVFNEVEELDIFTKERHDKLISITADLLRHLWNEDKQLYPLLRKEAEHNEKLKEILSLFTNGLGKINEDALKLLTCYSKGITNSNFQKEYERLFDAISKRIEYEENILFDEYEKANK